MELYKSSATSQINKSQKFVLPCQSRVQSSNTKEWLQIQHKLVEKSPVLKAVLERSNNVVVKYGQPKIMHNEYSVSEALYTSKVPNMIKYFCSFQCADDIANIVKKGYLCDGGEDIAYIVMPYYSLGDMNKYVWNRENFGLLKNILTQVSFAILYASKTCRFVHNDLHMYNILLRKTKKTKLVYGDIDLPLQSLYAVVMDFEKSTVQLGTPREAYYTIRDILNRATSLDNSDMSLAIDVSDLNQLMSTNTSITTDTYTHVKFIIDNAIILYEKAKSKLPPNPFLRSVTNL